MSSRNISGLDGSLAALLADFERRITELSRRRPTGSGGSTICDCEDGADGHSVTVFESVTEPPDAVPGDFWVVP